MKRSQTAGALALVLTALAGAEARAQSSAPRLRDMTTDRPDTTESPFTIDRGHLQLESTLFGFSRTRRDASGGRDDDLEVGTTNFRIGLTPALEANVVLQPLGRKSPSSGRVSTGMGDLALRAKLNFWGDDGVAERGQTAFAILPYVEIPLDRDDEIGDDSVGGGVLLPFAVALGGRFGLGLNAGVAVKRDDKARGYEAHPLLTASLGVQWTERWGAYHEVASELNRGDPAGDIVFINNGVTFRLRDNVQLDAGLNLGVTRAAERFVTFVGISARF